MKERNTVFGGRLFPTREKTNTPNGKREYMKQYMKAYRDRTRQRQYSPRTNHSKEMKL